MIVDGVGLVLEGGGMRCVFTAGVLDYFMDHDIEFPYVAGVSGGACAAACYISHQRGRQKKVFIDLFKRFKVVSLSQFFTKGAIFDLDLAVDRISHKILPFDFDASLPIRLSANLLPAIARRARRFISTSGVQASVL